MRVSHGKLKTYKINRIMRWNNNMVYYGRAVR